MQSQEVKVGRKPEQEADGNHESITLHHEGGMRQRDLLSSRDGNGNENGHYDK